jgi:ribosomal protein S1
MNLKKNNSTDNSIPIVDDSWWESLLGEDSKYPSTDNKISTNTYHEEEGEEIDWDLLEQYFYEDKILNVTITGYNKGGLLVRGDKFRGFVPNSHIKKISQVKSNQDRMHALKQYVGQEMQVKVIECDQKTGKLILSERAAEKGPGCRLDVMDGLEIGSDVSGEVTNITKFGIFLDLGGVEGLIHVSEISWGKVHHPAEIVSIGDSVRARVISIDREKMRIALSMKQLLPNPWYEFSEKYLEGDVVTVTITKVVGYGFFAEVENGIEGLVHISDIQSKDSTLTSDILRVGEKIIVTIKGIDVENRRLSMGFISRINENTL